MGGRNSSRCSRDHNPAIIPGLHPPSAVASAQSDVGREGTGSAAGRRRLIPLLDDRCERWNRHPNNFPDREGNAAGSDTGTPQLQGDAGGSEQFISVWSIASHPDFHALISSLRSYSFRVAATSPVRLPTRSILHVSHRQG